MYLLSRNSSCWKTDVMNVLEIFEPLKWEKKSKKKLNFWFSKTWFPSYKNKDESKTQGWKTAENL